MQSNGIDFGVSTGVFNPSTFVGAATGTLNNEQMISDTNTFISTWKTNAAVAATATVQLPLVSTGTYNFWVDWGDGQKDYVTSFAQIYVRETVARTHTYRTVGTYTIRITGVCRGWSFFGLTNEKPKIQSIERFGCLELINDTTNGQQFSACINLDLSNVRDTLSTKYLTNMLALLSSSPNLNVNLFNNWDVSKMTNISSVFFNCTNFNNQIGNWNVGNATSMFNLFINNTTFNQDISNWDVSNVTNMSSMFSGTTAFNIDIGSWNMSKVTDMSFMFNGAIAFNQDIGNWNIGLVTNISNFMLGKTPSTFSAANLDAIYNGWSSRPSQSNLSITFGTANYTIAGGSIGRAILVSRGWTIVDGGGI
jgi:surface protein